MKRKSLITGGAGFIGSHLAEHLIARGEEVYVIDDLSTGRVENLDGLRDNDRFHLEIASICNGQIVAELIDRCSDIYHLAAAVGVRLIVESPVHTIETNIHGTEIVLRHAAKKKKKVLIASTSEVYGKSGKDYLGEDDDMVLGPTKRARWSYACSKAVDEYLGLSYHNERGVPVVIVRLFNTIGPRQVGSYGMVLPRFVKQALANEPLTVYDDGAMVRCFSYVGDVVEAMVRLMEEPLAAGEVCNIGSEEAVTIRELAERVIEKVNPELKIEFVPYEKAYGKGFEDIRRRVPDISKIRNLIGYEPSRCLDDIIDLVVEYFREQDND